MNLDTDHKKKFFLHYDFFLEAKQNDLLIDVYSIVLYSLNPLKPISTEMIYH